MERAKYNILGREQWKRVLNWYEYSAKAVKKVDPRIKVGGPAICGIETEKWLRSFFEHCINNNLARWIL